MQYMGSKNRLAKDIAPIIQSYVDKGCNGYLEPFVGGANMIDKIKCDKKYGCDIHKYLIALLNKAKESTEDFPKTITEKEYLKIKNNKTAYEPWYVGLSGFCCSYGAKWFDTYARGNDERDRTGEAIRNIIKQAPNLKETKFKNCSFQDINENISNFVIYCDPPYRGTTKYSVNEFPYDEFYEWCRRMSKKNIVMVSEYDMPKDFKCIWEKKVKVSIDSNRMHDDKNNDRIEKLFVLNENLEKYL